MAVIINRPQIVRRRTEKVVVSPTGHLYDSNIVIIEEEEPAIMTTTSAGPESFSWNDKQSDENITIQTTAAPEPEKEEYVVVKEETKTSDGNVSKTFTDIIVVIALIAAIYYGGRMLFDYVQESESIRQINNQLESELDSDLTDSEKLDLRNFVDPNAEDAASITKRNAFRAGVDTTGIPDDGIVKVLETKPYYLLGQRKNGKIELRSGGTAGWRTNNPALFGWGDFAKETGAIGKYKDYAIYPTRERGMSATDVYLFSTNLFRDLSINDAIKKFYPKDKTKAERVAKRISVALNVSRYKTKMNKLSASQRKKVLNEIWKEEDNLSGIVRVYDNMEDFNRKGF